RVYEGGERRLERTDHARLGAGQRVRLGGIRDRVDEPAGDALALAVDLFDVSLRDLLLEQRVRHRSRVLIGGEQHLDQQEVDDEDDDERQPGSARRHSLLLSASLGWGWRWA